MIVGHKEPHAYRSAEAVLVTPSRFGVTASWWETVCLSGWLSLGED